MQSSGSSLNVLLNLGAAPALQGGAATSGAAEGGGFQQLMALLGDLGAQTGGQRFQQASAAQAKGVAVQAGAALAAQGLDIPVAAPITDILITPQDAAAMLEKLSAMMQQHEGKHGQQGDTSQQVLEQVQVQLEQMVQTDTPQTLAQVLEAVPEAKESRVVGLLSGIVQAVKKAVNGQAHAEKEAPTTLPDVMQYASAMMFQPDRRAPAPAALAPAQPETQAEEVASADNAQPASVLPLFAAVAAPLTPTAAPVGDIADSTIHAQTLSAAQRIDQLIPAMTPVEDKPMGKQALPDVTLPGFTAGEKPVRAPREAAAANAIASFAEALGAVDPGTQGNSGIVPPHLHASHASKTLDLNATPGFINQATVKEQVHVAITQASHQGSDRITIQLDPAELGRVEVKLHTGSDGQTQISFLVDKAETFDSLSRDARLLERSLQEAGIKADTGSMQFNLRQQPQPQLHSGLNDGQGQQAQQQTPDDDTAANDNTVSPLAAAAIPVRNYLINVRDGVDISA